MFIPSLLPVGPLTYTHFFLLKKYQGKSKQMWTQRQVTGLAAPGGTTGPLTEGREAIAAPARSGVGRGIESSMCRGPGLGPRGGVLAPSSASESPDSIPPIHGARRTDEKEAPASHYWPSAGAFPNEDCSLRNRKQQCKN